MYTLLANDAHDQIVLNTVPPSHSIRPVLLSSSGFTLIELIVIMVIISIMAVSALPRFTDLSFDSRGFHDETLSLLRYAQKAAIAQRRTVCVTFTSSTAALTIAPVAGSSTCNANITSPKGTTPYTVTAKSGISYATVPADFNFNALGQPNHTTQTWQVSGITTTLTVEAETGYVHD